MNFSLFPLFCEFSKENNLFKKEDKILLAVSGGADSTVMAHLFAHGGYNYAIAHCNFSLRGDDSEKDEQFVKAMSLKLDVPFHHIKFDTIEYCKQQGVSVEMGARMLRYEWFDQIMKEYRYNLLATAHHKDDIIETFLLNFSKGMGINAVHGIAVKNGYVIRPMLCFFRKEIERHAEKYKIDFVTDKTNYETDCERNKIRNIIVPVLEDLNSNFKECAIRTIDNLKEAKKVYQKRMDDITLELKDENGNIIINKLLELESPQSCLYELLTPLGFNPAVINSILNSLTDISGKQFFASDYRIVKDREVLIIEKVKNKIETVKVNISTEKQITYPFKADFEIIDNHPDFNVINPANIACIDAEKINSEILFRGWERGDFFYPLGMKGKKKVSDFFSDNKFSIPEKEKCRLLVSGQDIVWIVGHRLDRRFMVTGNTKKILKIIVH